MEQDLHKLSTKILSLLNSKDNYEDMIKRIVLLINENAKINSVGIRLKKEEDFPYFYTCGFTKDFVRMENYLCVRDHKNEMIRDSSGNPYVECMCGNVLCGRTDPKFPFFTNYGSFWSNNTSELLANTTAVDRQTRTRNRCNSEGYESVALIPIKIKKVIVGLLQLNDFSKNIFNQETINFFEGLSSSIGTLFALIEADNMLKDKYQTKTNSKN